MRHGIACVCAGLVAATAFAWLMILMPRPGPHDVNTITGRALIVTPRPGATR